MNTALPVRLLLALGLLALPGAVLCEAPQAIDLASALRLAGAQNLDVRIAEQRMQEAQAQHDQARQKFLPWLTPSVGYRRHTGSAQTIDGDIIDADFDSHSIAGTLSAQLDVGSAIYQSLAARQTAEAARQQFETRRLQASFDAAGGYFDLLQAQVAIGVAEQGLKLAEEHDAQLQRAVAIGLAFKGDAYRTQLQVEDLRRRLLQAQAARRDAAARLAQTLRLPPETDLQAADAELVPLPTALPVAEFDTLLARAYEARPELKLQQAQQRAAESLRDGARYAPLVPTLDARLGYGGLGGGRDGGPRAFDDNAELLLGLSWRIGPGGLFDRARVRAAEARLQAGGYALEQARAEVARELVVALAQLQSLTAQLEHSKRALTAAEQLSRLAHERREFGVGAVLETIQADEALLRSRGDYVARIAEFNKANYALQRALGSDGPDPAPSAP